MSLVEEDIIKNPKPLIFILNAKTEVKIIGIYTNLSEALKSLYLADEAAVLLVNYMNYKSKPCINDTYDCYIGKFYFNEDDLIYQRNLTGELEQISDDQHLITSDDFKSIKDELDQIEIEQKKKNINEYHEKAHDSVDKAIIEKFNQLSSLLTQKFNKQLARHNEEYDMNFEYDLTYEVNKFYQESNEKLNALNLEEKVETIKKIAEYISKITSELETLKELAKDMGEDEDEDEYGGYDIPREFWDENMDDEFVMGDIRAYFCKKGPHYGEPGGKMLYGSPPPSPQNKKMEFIEKPKIQLKEKDPTKKKTVSFDLDKIEYYDYKRIVAPSDKN